jgi:transposase
MTNTPDRNIICNVDQCSNCSYDISKIYTKYTRHQVVDLSIKVFTTQYKRAKKECPNCNHTNFGQLPNFATHNVQYGPNILGLASYLNNVHYIPTKRTVQIINELCGTNISPATIVNNSYKLSNRLEDKFIPVIKEILTNSTLLHSDETSLNVNGDKFWVHLASNPLASYSALYNTRGDKAVRDINILPSFAGTLVHDAFSMYDKYGGEHQLCVAHVLRELQAVTDYHKITSPDVKTKCWSEEIFNKFEEYIHLSKAGKTIKNPADKILEIFKKASINDPPGKLGKKHQALRKRIITRRNDYLRFTQNPSIPATNNFAEREIRMVKVKMKVSGMAKTVAGARAFTNVRSFVSTLNKHNIPVLQSISDVFAGTVWVPKIA